MCLLSIPENRIREPAPGKEPPEYLGDQTTKHLLELRVTRLVGKSTTSGLKSYKGENDALLRAIVLSGTHK